MVNSSAIVTSSNTEDSEFDYSPDRHHYKNYSSQNDNGKLPMNKIDTKELDAGKELEASIAKRNQLKKDLERVNDAISSTPKVRQPFLINLDSASSPVMMAKKIKEVELNFDSDSDDLNRPINTIQMREGMTNSKPSNSFIYTSPKTQERSPLLSSGVEGREGFPLDTNIRSSLLEGKSVGNSSPSLLKKDHKGNVPSSDELLIKLGNSRRVFEKNISVLKSSSPVYTERNVAANAMTTQQRENNLGSPSSSSSRSNEKFFKQELIKRTVKEIESLKVQLVSKQTFLRELIPDDLLESRKSENSIKKEPEHLTLFTKFIICLLVLGSLFLIDWMFKIAFIRQQLRILKHRGMELDIPIKIKYLEAYYKEWMEWILKKFTTWKQEIIS